LRSSFLIKIIGKSDIKNKGILLQLENINNFWIAHVNQNDKITEIFTIENILKSISTIIRKSKTTF